MDWIASAWFSSKAWECVEYVAEAIVIIGCLFEGLADFKLILKRNEPLRERVEKAAFLVLMVGLAIGLAALVRTNQLFTDTISDLYVQARYANDRATTASDKAKKAQDRADKASKHEEELETRTEREIDARLVLEARSIWQGPRELLIVNKESTFKRRLATFSGQQFRISICKNDIPPGAVILGNEEIMLAANATGNALARSGWIGVADPPQQPIAVFPLIVEGCTSIAITPRLRPSAPESTRKAAGALNSVFNEVLMEGLTSYVAPYVTPNGSLDTLRPDVIEVRVGRHPANPRETPKR